MTAPIASSVRYTVRLSLQPGDEVAEFTVVTAMGESKAVALAAMRLARVQPEARLVNAVISLVETEFTIDPERDLLDYWEVA